MHLVGFFGVGVFCGFVFFFVRCKTKWLVLKMVSCLKTANAKMLNIQNFGLRLAVLIISQVSQKVFKSNLSPSSPLISIANT